VIAIVGVGGVGLAVVAKWISGRLTRVTDAYGEERAKLLAHSHNLEKLIEQTRELTKTAESIKAAVSEEAWLKQQRWSKRLDVYVEVIDKLEAFRQAAQWVAFDVNTRRKYTGDSETVLKNLTGRQDSSLEQYNVRLMEWHHVIHLARLVCSEPAIRILDQFEPPDLKQDDIVSATHNTVQLVRRISKEFVIAAREELGYEQMNR
jgi:hypothetical protein